MSKKKTVEPQAKPNVEEQLRRDFPQDYAEHVIKVRVTEERFEFIDVGGNPTPWPLEADRITGKQPAHDRMLELVSENPTNEYRVVEI